MSSTAASALAGHQGLHLYAASTANNHKVTTLLAELGLPYTLHKVDLVAAEQKTPDFLKLNPAGLTPVLVDFDATLPASSTSAGASQKAAQPAGFVLVESGAILYYLAASKDPSHRLLPEEPAARAECLSWVFNASADLGDPTLVVVKALQFGVPFTADTVQRSVELVRSSFKHLDARLAKTGGWLAAGQYSIADVAFTSKVLYCTHLLGIDLKADYPSLHAWLDKVLSRPAVRKGLNQPDPCPFLEGSKGETSTDAGQQAVEAARGRLAKLGLHLGATR